MRLDVRDNLPPVFTVGDVLRKLRKDRGWSIQDLARRSGVDKMTISKFERGASDTRHSTSVALSKALGFESADGIYAEWRRLVVGSESGEQGEPTRPEAAVVDIDVAGGYERDAIPVIAEGEATPHGLRWMTDVARSLVIEMISRPHDVKDKDAYGVLVLGDSMRPVYKKGHRVVVSPLTPVESGDEVYVQLADGRRLIKVAHRIPKGWRLESANPEYEPFEVTDADVVAIHPIVWSKRKLPGIRTLDEWTGKRMAESRVKPPAKKARRAK